MKQMLKRDLWLGIVRRWWKYGIVFISCFLMLLFAVRGQTEYAAYIGFTAKPHAGDLYAYLLRGALPFVPAQNSVFELPYPWLVLHMLFFFLTANHVSKDAEATGVQIILQSGGRSRWVWSKYIFCLFSTTGFFFCVIAASALAALVAGGSASLGIGEYLYFLLPQAQRLPFSVGIVYGLPFLALLTMVVLQVTAELLTNSVGGYLTVLVVSIVSCYYKTPFLPANGTMLLRSGFMAENGISANLCCVFCIIVVAFCVLLGWRLFCRRDLL